MMLVFTVGRLLIYPWTETYKLLTCTWMDIPFAGMYVYDVHSKLSICSKMDTPLIWLYVHEVGRNDEREINISEQVG